MPPQNNPNYNPLFDTSSPSYYGSQPSSGIPSYQAGNGNPYSPLTFNPFPTYGQGMYQPVNYGQPTPPAPPGQGLSSTSTGFRGLTGDLEQQLRDMETRWGSSPEAQRLNDVYGQMNTLIQGQRDALGQRRAQQEASINAQFAQRQSQLQDTQGRETGSRSVALARMGGYLGDSGSGQGVMQNLENTHKQELSYLESLKATALNEARTAYEDKDFAYAQSLVNNVKDLESEINTRKRAFFSDMLQLTQEGRAQAGEERAVSAEGRAVSAEERAKTTFASDLEDKRRSRAEDELEQISIYDPGAPELDGFDTDSIETRMGVPKGFVSKYLKTQKEARDLTKEENIAKKNQAEVTLTKGIYDILNDVPLGQSITIAGKTYKGLKQPPSSASGAAANTKKMKAEFLSGLPSYFQGKANFMTINGQAKISPQDYIAALQFFLGQGYGERKDFLEEAPPEIYLSPEGYLNVMGQKFPIKYRTGE